MNIHIIPTDRPSILFIDNDDKKLRLYKKPMVSEYALNQNIYITSYEEIKEVDYVITPTNDIIQWTKVFQPIGKKIIITTDKSLINEGIQSIDDEFLQWFVKNPSCEEVEVKKEKVILGEVVGTTYIDFKYKIMPKKETLEEAAEKYANELPEPYNYGINPDKKKGFIEGAKWQQEQDRRNV